jgi:diguanylate cyclase (GGDEF)-like protein
MVAGRSGEEPSSVWRRWRRPAESLPTRILLFVFTATLITSLAVTAISVRSMSGFLRAEIDQKFPAILASTAQRLDLWYDQRVLEIGVFGSSRILAQNLGRLSGGNASRARQELEQYLEYVLERFPQYEALLLLDPQGAPLLSVGDAPELPEPLRRRLASVGHAELGNFLRLGGRQIQLASSPVLDAEEKPLGSLHALLRLDLLGEILQSDDLGPEGTLLLIGSSGEAVLSTPGRPARARYDRPLPEAGAQPAVDEYTSEDGESLVGSAARMSRFGWSLVVEEPYRQAFAPVVASIRRVLGINLGIVLALCLAAFRIAVSIVRPIEALSGAARRISEGEEHVEIPESRSRDEVGLLTRSFAEMMRRLDLKANQLEASQRAVEESNQRLQQRNEELQQANEVLEQISITDGLTKLHNHRYFQDTLSRETKRALRTRQPLALMLVDIDYFKRWNDRLGHAAGDEILRKVASTMSGLLRGTDLLARYGGEEFALLAPNTDLEGALALAEKIRMEIQETDLVISPPSEKERVTVSIGVALYAGDRDALFNEADRALYRAKAEGRNCVMVAGTDGAEPETTRPRGRRQRARKRGA